MRWWAASAYASAAPSTQACWGRWVANITGHGASVPEVQCLQGAAGRVGFPRPCPHVPPSSPSTPSPQVVAAAAPACFNDVRGQAAFSPSNDLPPRALSAGLAATMACAPIAPAPGSGSAIKLLGLLQVGVCVCVDGVWLSAKWRLRAPLQLTACRSLHPTTTTTTTHAHRRSSTGGVTPGACCAPAPCWARRSAPRTASCWGAWRAWWVLEGGDILWGGVWGCRVGWARGGTGVVCGGPGGCWRVEA